MAINCTPGNYQCGKVCIPDSHNCNLTVDDVAGTSAQELAAMVNSYTAKLTGGKAASSSRTGKLTAKGAEKKFAGLSDEEKLSLINGHANWWADKFGKAGKQKPEAKPKTLSNEELVKLDISSYQEEAKRLESNKNATARDRVIAVHNKTFRRSRLAAVYDRVGFHGKPEQEASEEALFARDDILKGDNGLPIKMYRGFGSKPPESALLRDEFINGEKHLGSIGMYGNGTYVAGSTVATERVKRTGLETYGGGKKEHTLALALKADAKLITTNEAIAKMREQGIDALNVAEHEGEGKVDPAEWAAANGYDAMYTGGWREGREDDPTFGRSFVNEEYFMILNRGKVVVAPVT